MSFPKRNGSVLVAVVAGVLILALLNGHIVQKERVIEKGRAVLLSLAPRDPRSLMQGDYVALRFALPNEVRDQVDRSDIIVLKVGENNVAHFERKDEANSALQPDEVRFRYRLPNGFFFEEGLGEDYVLALYGEFRVVDNGDAVLVLLRDKEFKVVGRSP